MVLCQSSVHKRWLRRKRCHWTESRCFLLEPPAACREGSLRCIWSWSNLHCIWRTQNQRFSNFYGYWVCWLASNLDEVCSSSASIWVLLKFSPWLRLQRLTEVFRAWTDSLAGLLRRNTRWWWSSAWVFCRYRSTWWHWGGLVFSGFRFNCPASSGWTSCTFWVRWPSLHILSRLCCTVPWRPCCCILSRSLESRRKNMSRFFVMISRGGRSWRIGVWWWSLPIWVGWCCCWDWCGGWRSSGWIMGRNTCFAFKIIILGRIDELNAAGKWTMEISKKWRRRLIRVQCF